MTTFGDILDAARGLGTAQRNQLVHYEDKNAETLSWYDVTQMRGAGEKAVKAIARAYVALNLDTDGAWLEVANGRTPEARKLLPRVPSKTEQALSDRKRCTEPTSPARQFCG